MAERLQEASDYAINTGAETDKYAAGKFLHTGTEENRVVLEQDGFDKQPLLSNEVKVSRRRYVILGLFGLVTMSNAFIWISLNAITDLVMEYYQVRAIVVDWLSLTFLLVPAVTAIPGAFVIARLGLKLGIVLPAACHAIGTAVRIAGIGQDAFAYMAIGQFIASFGTVFILAVPPQLAAVWFSERERTSATTVGVLTNTFGISVGFLLATMLVPDTKDVTAIGNGIQNLIITHAVYCTVLLILVLVFVRDAPPAPPSVSQARRQRESISQGHTPFFISVMVLLRNPHYVMIVIAYSINFGVVFALPTLLNQMVKVESSLKHYHTAEKSIGWVGFVGPVGGIIGSLLAGRIIDLFKVYKKVTCSSLLLSTACILGFTQTLFHSREVYLLGITFTLLCFFSFPYLGYGLDHIAEVSYPIPEGISAAVPMILANSSGFVFIYVFQVLIDNGYLTVVLYLFLTLEGLAFLLSTFAKTEMSRQLADQINDELSR